MNTQQYLTVLSNTQDYILNGGEVPNLPEIHTQSLYIWELATEFSDNVDRAPTVDELQDMAAESGINPNSARVQWYRWVKAYIFHNMIDSGVL